LTHIALRVRDIDRSAAFYSDYVALEIVHERREPGHTRVAWIAERGRKTTFVIVLLECPYQRSPEPPVDHLGFAVAKRADVDRVAARARADSILVEEPVDAGPIVGYYCIVADPDGHRVEFSHAQPIPWD
jgi:catechol 2,3-dioxygenase-like lactoylglutathione lyase family enzyme